MSKYSAYQLGRVTFTVDNCDPLFRRKLDSLIPIVKADAEPKVIDVAGFDNLRELVNVILKDHDNAIWIDAGALVAPSGKRFLIAGESSAGKSTLTMAMAIGYGWRVITEDLLLIDTAKDQSLSLRTPFSFKPGTIQLLESTIGTKICELIDGEWLPLNTMAVDEDLPACFDCVIVLEGMDPVQPVLIGYMKPHHFVRHILSCSNLLHLEDGIDKLLEYLQSSHCYVMQYGSLKQRIDTMLQLESNYNALAATEVV